MSKIKNTAEVKTYNEPAKPSIKVHSHWNRKEFIELQIGPDPDTRMVVCGDDLKRAIDNCMNVGI